jgi:sigma-E factor negative regulatory protein RseB
MTPPSTGRLASTALLCWLLLPGLVAAESAEELVQRAVEAGRVLDYDGVFVYQRDSALDAMRLIHRGRGSGDGDGERERLVSLSGPAREVVRDGSRVTCTFADDREVMVEKRPPRDLPGFGLTRPAASLADDYEFRKTKPDRIAGRQTHVVQILPRTLDRYGYTLWIDQDSGLLLKSVVLDHGGRALEQVQFAQVAIGGPIADELLQPEVSGVDFTWYTNETGPSDGAGDAVAGDWRIGWLPAGFVILREQTQRMVASEMPVRHFVYSDGLASVSIFIEKLQTTTAPVQGYSSMGAVNAFSRVADNFQITVVGEVPQTTVRQIALAVANRTTE